MVFFSSNIDRIKDGIGDKLGLIVCGIVMFLTCTAISLINEWRITLVAVGVAPISAVLMSVMARVCEIFAAQKVRLSRLFYNENLKLTLALQKIVGQRSVDV